MMYCPHCKSAIDDDDLFCPKCGKDSRAHPGAPPLPPPSVVVDTQAGARVAATRVPQAESGRKYPGLTAAADLLINTGSTLKTLCYVLAVLALGSMLAYNPRNPLFGIVIGLFAAGVVAITGWLLWLSCTVVGELIYLIIDVEADLRRR
jgi:hypothetical protein